MPHLLKQFRGIFPAALTLFDKENNLDEHGTAQHWDWLIRQGIDGLVIAGTSGEFIAMENDSGSGSSPWRRKYARAVFR